MRTDARSDLIRAVGDDSTPAEKALWHVVVEMEDWVEAGLLVDVPTVQRLLDRVEAVLGKKS